MQPPTVESLSTSNAKGDIKLFPTARLAGVNFEGPRGLAVGPDGELYVADPRRNTVYRIAPDVGGEIGPTSVVGVALGTGGARSILGIGERGAGRGFPVSQPFRLSMGEDGILVANTAYGLVAYDVLAREAEVLLLDTGRDELQLSVGDAASATLAVSTKMILQTALVGFVRIDMDMLSSDDDPTRTLAPAGGGSLQLTDTTRAKVWTFDPAGRLVEQRKRTGELDMTVAYADAQSDRVTSLTDALGGATTFTYTSGKLSAITDQRGRVTTVSVDGSGDLAGFTQPDGEVYAFAYDGHHMTSKTSPRGDVTAYTFGTDGTLATSTKPGGETSQLFSAYSQDATYDASAQLQRAAQYIDARGVTHSMELDGKGKIKKETYVADGVTRVVENVYAPTLGPDVQASERQNAILRLAYQTVNGVPLSPTRFDFDTLGRPVRQTRLAGGSSDMLHRWHYRSDGWIAATYDAPSSAAQRFDRDAFGHVTRIADVLASSAADDEVTAPATGRETDFTWRADGQPATMTTHGVTTTFAYDDVTGTANLTGTSDTLGRTTTLGYDALGNVTSVSDGTASSSFDFDLNNRLTTSRDALGNATTFGYSVVSCGCSEADEVTSVHTPDLPAGVQWSMTYGPQGRLASVTDPHDFTETYDYETTGELRAVTDRLGRTTTTTHDQLGRVLAVVDTLGRNHQRSYPVPQTGAWVGASLTAGSPDATAPLTGRGAGLRSGEHQIGLDAFDTEGFPAQISFYRDATFALGYSSYFDDGQRLTARVDRTAEAIDSAVVPRPADPGTVVHEQYGYDLTTSAPLLSSVDSPIFGTTGNASSVITYNLEHDQVNATGFGGGLEAPATYAYTRDAGGRVTSHTNRFVEPDVLTTFDSTYAYYPDGRLASNGNADGAQAASLIALPSGTVATSSAGPPGSHGFTYDARGLLATQTDFDGTYRYAYDELGRNKRLEFPDGHARVQIYDDLGRITSRCYEYPADASLNRCYGAQYDAVGNPVRLIDPEGSDVYTYDALDRLTSVTRKDVGGLTVSVEDYAFNALGALSTNAGFAVDHRRPRLDGAGVADAAVPATVDGLPVALDAGGRVTALGGMSLLWSTSGQVRHVDLPVPSNPIDFAFDAFNRRAWTHGPATTSIIEGSTSIAIQREVYLYEGVHRVAAVGPGLAGFPQGAVLMSFLYDGVDHPLRLSSPEINAVEQPPPPANAQQVFYSAIPRTVAYYELDLAGNVRRLRQPGGVDLGGYRYSAFGETVEDTVVLQTANPLIQADNRTQPLRWKGMWRFDLGGGVEVYDARARMWSPRLGTFLSVDEFRFHDARSTLWGWGGQNPIRWSDPFGRSVVSYAHQTQLLNDQQDQLFGASAFFAGQTADAWASGSYGAAAFDASVTAATGLGGAFVSLLPRHPESADFATLGCPIELGGVRPVPNPYGRLGGPAHQAKVAEVAAGVESRGLDPRFEHQVKTPGAEKGSRFVDVVGVDETGQVTEMHQVGRQTQSGNPVARETRALDDIEQATGVRPQFHPYNP